MTDVSVEIFDEDKEVSTPNSNALNSLDVNTSGIEIFTEEKDERITVPYLNKKIRKEPTEEEEKDVISLPVSDAQTEEQIVTKSIMDDYYQISQGTEALGGDVYDKQMAEIEASQMAGQRNLPSAISSSLTPISNDFIELADIEYDRVKKVSDNAMETKKAIEQGAKNQNISEDEFVQKYVYANMEEGPLRSILEYTGATGIKTLLNLQYGIGNIVGRFGNTVESLAESVERANPAVYDAITSRNPRSFANQVTRDMGDILMALEGASLNVFSKSARSIAKDLKVPTLKEAEKFVRKQRVDAQMDRIFLDKKPRKTGFDSRKLENIQQEIEKLDIKTLNPALLKRSTEEVAKKAKANAKKTADKYIKEDPNLIESLKNNIDAKDIKIGATVAASPENIARVEGIIGKTISKIDEKTGELVVDSDALRIAGAEKLDEFSIDTDTMLSPIVSVENFDAVVSIVGDLKKKYPSYFTKGDNKPITQQIFEAVMQEDLLPDPEFAKKLTDYGLSFEDFSLLMVGSLSKAGQVLNRASQISKGAATINNKGIPVALREAKDAKKELSAMDMLTDEDALRNKLNELTDQNFLGKVFQGLVRWEGIRRGLLVSQLKTASRNLSSFFIRSPLEAVENYFDTALYNLAAEGKGAALKSLVSWTNIKDSGRHLKYAFTIKDYIKQKEYIDFILADKGMGKLEAKLFDNINEIRKGREFKGTGKATKYANKTFEVVEKAVDIVNIPNRFQEFVTRRAVFLAELQRLVRNEYKVDFIEEINKGNLMKFMNNGYAPKGSNRSFYDLAADAGEKALDITYAKTPDVPLFRMASNFIVNSGVGTMIIDFPRFMFNGIELLGQYTGGLLLPVIQKMSGAKQLDRMGRKYLTRNITGIAAIYAGYKYLTSEDAPEDYKEIRVGPNHAAEIDKLYEERAKINRDKNPGDYANLTRQMQVLANKMKEPSLALDTTTLYPARQIMFLANVAKEAVRARGSLLDTDREYYFGTYWPETQNNLKTFFESSEGREIVEVLVGSGLSRGVAASTPGMLVDLFSPGELDGLSNQKVAEKTAAAIANYVQTHVVKLIEIAELQRSLGYRTSERKDVASDPSEALDPNSFTDVFIDNFKRPFRQTGIANLFNPSQESTYPTRTSIYGEQREVRIKPTLTLLTGISLKALPNEAGEYLQSLGIAEFQAGAKKSIIPSYRRLSNEYIQKRLPLVVQLLKDNLEPVFEDEYDLSSDMTKELQTKEDFVKAKALEYMNVWLSNMRSAGKTFADAETTMLDPDKALFYRSLETYSKIPRKQRVSASSLFIQEKDRAPKIHDTEDILTLIKLNSDNQSRLKSIDVK